MLFTRNALQIQWHGKFLSKMIEKGIPCKKKSRSINIILISDKIDFRAIKIIRDKKEHYIMIKAWIH